MSLREKLNSLHDELDGFRDLKRSISPSKLMAKSSRHSSRSPRPSMSVPQQPQPMPTIAHDSRPDIAAWPAPPPQNALSKLVAQHHQKVPLTTSTGTSPIPESHFQASSSLGEDSNRLLQMLMSSSPTPPGSTRGREFELRRKIQNLEETVAEYERQKFSVLGTFNEYRDYVAERERTLEADYSNKIIALSEEVLGAKKDFETRMKNFQALQEQFNQEKEQALENLRQEHQKEIEMLERRVAGSQLLNLEQKYIIEIRRLEDERKSLKMEKDRLVETFDMKLKRAQSLYETQLSTAKALYSKELETLRSHEENLKLELSARHEEFRDRVQELKLQSRQSREEVSACKTEITLLQKKLNQKECELQGISKELESARAELVLSMRKLREMDIRYAKTFDELGQRETELNKKAELLDAAEDSKIHLESTIRKLQAEVKGLKNKVDFLEIERDNLQCQSESQNHLQASQINTLEAVLESVTKEKETSKEHYEKLLEQADAREKSLRKELSTKFNELESQYNSLKDFVDESGAAFDPESSKVLEEVGILRAQKSYLENEIANLQAQRERNERPTFEYLNDVSKAVDSIRKNVEENIPQSSKASNKQTSIGSDLQGKLNDTQSREIHVVLNKLIQVEKDVETIIKEKNEAESKLVRLEEQNRTLAKRLSESQQNEPSKDQTKTLENAIEQERKVEELKDQMKLADRKNKILRELIEYQKGPVDNEVDNLLKEVGTEDLSQEELHQVFEKYENLKKPQKKVETRDAETRPKPQMREMSLQTNIEIKQAPSQSEELQKEIVGMLAHLMNGKVDEYSDLLELKKALMSATESNSSSDEMPESPRVHQSYQKSSNKIQNIFSNMSDRRDKKYKVSTSERVDRRDDQMDSRSRSPSVLSRVRERTPSKTTASSSTSMDQSLSSSRNFAYDLSKKKSSKMDNNNKPAWKF